PPRPRPPAAPPRPRAVAGVVRGRRGPALPPPEPGRRARPRLATVTAKAPARHRREREAAGTDLQHEGGTQYVPDASRQAIPAGERTIKQGFVEESNVNTMAAMTEMLTVLHRYGAAQKTLSTLDAARGIAVSDLAKPV
ncbi:MAG: flagellar basal body rod C-terminal domain-containing protein, partial [Gemmatimonadaceae bacterium]